MSIIDRIKAPTPEFFKKVIKYSLGASAGAIVILNADTLGNAVVPGFTFKLLPGVAVICKNLIVAGIAIAAIAKTTKVDVDQTENKN